MPIYSLALQLFTLAYIAVQWYRRFVCRGCSRLRRQVQDQHGDPCPASVDQPREGW